MLVVNEARHLGGEEFRQRGDRAREHPVRGRAVEVADVRTQHDLVARGHGDRVFHVRAHADDGLRQPGRQCVRRGGVAAGPAQEDGGFVPRETHDRVVHRTGDRAVVTEKQIGDARQSRTGLGVIGAQRFIGQVRTGRDQRPVHGREQAQVQRSRRQQGADPRVARRDAVRKTRVGAFWHQHDRSLR